MKTTVQRAVWAFTLKATVLRPPLPPAPMQAPPAIHANSKPLSEAEAFRQSIKKMVAEIIKPLSAALKAEPGAFKLGNALEASTDQVFLPRPSSDWSTARLIGMDGAGGDDLSGVAYSTVPAGKLKAGEGVKLDYLVEAFLLALAAGTARYAGTAYRNEHLGNPFAAGGFHQGGVRLVGERGPELERTQRGTGRTSRQMLEAPIGAAFLWVHDQLHYPRELARHLGRTDLRIVGPSWLQNGWRGLRLPALVVDHAAWGRLTRIQHDWLDTAQDYIGSRPPPVVSWWPRRPGKSTALQALEAARREQWCRDLDREISQSAIWDVGDLEGSSCD